MSHAQVMEPGDDALLHNDKALHPAADPARIEGLIRMEVTAFDWDGLQHLRKRFTREEWVAEG